MYTHIYIYTYIKYIYVHSFNGINICVGANAGLGAAVGQAYDQKQTTGP